MREKLHKVLVAGSSLPHQAFAVEHASRNTHVGTGIAVVFGGLTLAEWQSVFGIIGICFGIVLSAFSAWVNWSHKRKIERSIEND